MVASGAAIVSMMGQLGGAIGIAVLATLMQRDAQLHRSYLSANLVPSGMTLNERIDRLTALLAGRGMSWAEARKAAVAMINQSLDGQSLMLTYGNLYVVVGTVALVLILLVFLFEKTPLSHPRRTQPDVLSPEIAGTPEGS
jgi:DHA2 family multidrug resistance protein